MDQKSKRQQLLDELKQLDEEDARRKAELPKEKQVPEGFKDWNAVYECCDEFWRSPWGKDAINRALMGNPKIKDGVKQTEDAGEQHKGPQMA
jgi:hypothetical protein